MNELTTHNVPLAFLEIDNTVWSDEIVTRANHGTDSCNSVLLGVLRVRLIDGVVFRTTGIDLLG